MVSSSERGTTMCLRNDHNELTTIWHQFTQREDIRRTLKTNRTAQLVLRSRSSINTTHLIGKVSRFG
ncbi:hypothetical protein EYC84_002628 [Monilinia fructicola]|uniref:Uncharacterized protein n=1 Tax=Monilinia fructicola TaxID=38448 RepID=A0A5M9JR72_MONFR|nr:hypothetical protein EYC84_002628 [Monilinia fructicola]